MSQHYFDTTSNKQNVTIVTGWDRPTQGFFMYIRVNRDEPDCDDMTPCPNCEEVYLYHNTDDMNPLAWYPKTMDYYLDKLAEFSLELPLEIVDNLQGDRDNNVGNHFVNYRYENGQLKSEMLG